MGSHLTFNTYSENSCSIASVADRGQQLEVIAHGAPVEVTEPLALDNVTAVDRRIPSKDRKTAPRTFGAVLLSASLP
jgi:hypothetical protein